MRVTVAGLVVVEVAGTGPGDGRWRRWLEELPPADPGLAAAVRWRPSRAAGGRRTAGGGWELWGPGHSPLLPIQDALLARQASLVHAATLLVRGSGVVVTGPSGAGKTLASLAALSFPGIRLVGDDLAAATGTGRVVGIPTPIALRGHHLPLVPAAGRPDAEQHWSRLLAAAVKLPGARPAGRWVRDRVARRTGTAAGWARRVRTDHVAMPPGRLFGAGQRAAEGQAVLVVALEPPGEARRDAIDAAAAAEALRAAAYGNEDLDAAAARYAAEGMLDLAEHRGRALEVLAAFAATATARLRVRLPAAAPIAAQQRYLLDAIDSALPPAAR